jgi:uncharacterized protein
LVEILTCFMTTSPQRTDGQVGRFSRLEDPASDFPFYNGAPKFITSRQWFFIMAMVVVGFLALASPIPWPNGDFWPFVPALLMPGLPIAALAYVASDHWRAIFGTVGGREVKLMFGFALLNIVVSMTVGAIVLTLAGATSNAMTVQLATLDMADRVAIFAKTIPQLLGEEVITILPFLAILQWLTQSLQWGRKASIVAAWVCTSVVFGLLHLPTYDWNWVQCIVVIGSARMVLTLAWIRTKNLWVSTGAHIANDWFLFAMGLWGAGLVGKT